MSDNYTVECLYGMVTTYLILSADTNNNTMHKRWIDAISALNASVVFMWYYTDERIVTLDVADVDELIEAFTVR